MYSFTRLVLMLTLVSGITACAELGQVRSPAEMRGMPLGTAASMPDKDDGRIRGSGAAQPDQPAAEPAKPKPSIILGTDRFFDPDALRERPSEYASSGDVTLNFVNTDIREVVRSILGDVLQLNYVIDPDVAGTTTLQTSRPVDRGSLLPTLAAILQINGATLLQQGSLYKIVRLDENATATVPLESAVGPGYGIQIVPLRYIAAKEMAKILEAFAPGGTILKTDDTRNLIILAGTGEARNTLLGAIDLFDVDWIAGMSFGLFPLQNAKAETLVRELEAIFGDGGNSPLGSLIRFVPVNRMNAVIVISSRSEYLKKVQGWIDRLDQGIDGASSRIYVYYVENVRAADLAQVLNDMFNQRQGAGEAASLAPGLVPVSIESTDAGPGDTGADGEAATRQPSYGGLLTNPYADNGTASNGGQVRIIADEATNSLVVLATPQDYRMVEQAVRKLDIIPLQVLIEATIAEVTLNDQLRYGVQWFFDSGSSNFALSEFVDGTVGQVFPGFSYLFRMSQDVRVVLNALSSITDVNIISSPQLMVLDNRTAELQVGDQVPIATRSAVSVNDPNSPIVNTIEFRDTGVILRVTPRVNAGGLVTMEIEQEVSSVVNTTTSGIDSPTIQQRRVTSSVAIQSGETVTLGGLISESRGRTNSGVPFLSEIPAVGTLFGTKSKNEVRTELLILITPRVVRNAADARQVTDELRNRMRAIQPLSRKVE